MSTETVEQAIGEFAGPSNATLRKSLRAAAAAEYPVSALESVARRVALSIVGRAKLAGVLAAVDAEMARAEVES